MSETLKMVDRVEANEGVIMQIYDMCNNKKEYRKFLNFSKKAFKEFKSLEKKKDTKVYQIKKIKINDTVSVESCIMNFDPGSYNDSDAGLEIMVTIADDSKNNLSTRGSGMYGGCNEAEIGEFITLITDGYHDFTKEF